VRFFWSAIIVFLRCENIETTYKGVQSYEFHAISVGKSKLVETGHTINQWSK